MTIALGFLCHDGVVLCTDSLESDGYTKHYVNKIEINQYPDKKWGLALAGAGDSAVFKTFVDRLRRSFDDDEYDRENIENKLSAIYKAARQKCPKTPFRILVALYGFNREPRITAAMRNKLRASGEEVGTWDCHLYRENSENCLERITSAGGFAAAGLGSELSAMFLKNLADWRMSVDEAVHLGIHTIGLAKEHVDGCGGDTRLVIYRRGTDTFDPSDESQVRTIRKLESAQVKDFQESLHTYWKQQRNKRRLPKRYETPHDKWKKAQKKNKKTTE